MSGILEEKHNVVEGIQLLSGLDHPASDSDVSEVQYLSEKPDLMRRRTWLRRLHITRDPVRTMKNIICFIAPSFLTSIPSDTPTQLRPTAFLDGLRGVAAWAVFNTHLSSVLVRDSGASFGHPGGHWEPWKLPILNLIFKGDFAVGIFFVISGFALSISPVSQMNKSPRNVGQAMTKMASAAFRRPARLLIPSWAAIFYGYILLELGYVQWMADRMPEFDKVIHGWSPGVLDKPTILPTYWAQFCDVIKTCGQMLDIFERSNDADWQIKYNGPLYTIKMEFRCSLVLYLTHLGLFFVRRPWRMAITAGLVLIGIMVWSFDFPLFWAGFLIAEYDVICRQQGSAMPILPDYLRMPRLQVSENSKRVGWWVLFIIGCYIGSWPAWDTENSPLYSWMVGLTPFGFLPADRLWTGIGATMVLLAISRITALRNFFSYSLIQYLGKISFSLYLVHFWIVQGFGEWVYFEVWSITGTQNMLAATFGFVVAYLVLLTVTVWVADIFWRLVDIPSNEFGGTLQRWFFQES